MTVTADQSLVVAGDDIDYDVTVTNTGGLPLTEVSVIAPDVADCSQAIGDLAPGASTTYACEHTTTPPTCPQMTNQVLVTTGQGVFGLSGTRGQRVDAPDPELTVDLSAEQPSVISGSDMFFDLTVTNTGNLTLTGVTVTAPDTPGCADAEPTTLAPGAQYSDNCQLTAQDGFAPTFTNFATADSTQTSPVNDTAAVTVLTVQPDALIRLGAGASVGNDLYNTNGAGQTRSTTVPTLGTATFTATFQNDGTMTDTLTVLGQGTTNRYTVTYKQGATNVTTAVVAGTYTLANLPAGGTRTLTIQIKAKPGTPINNLINRLLTLTSTTNTTRTDTVKATVRRR